ncbi:hypothetical protein QKG27_gp082 [Gallid alphaherpesvirus 3]|uniref:Uncharacterized protein ORF361 n=1 Tax=Gallid alphaherpesvirus 3 TaxID=35250 RepID=F8TC57_9ALPH|nr:hypothetical protein QKG27_gp082 [Gallid alphaherpesvirus 3]AEI00268.1 hypothetical protein [Gallid alphaherpesvirus 3]QEY02286.1 hypothetical protein [Gallid alphaherpesvirus 3]
MFVSSTAPPKENNVSMHVRAPFSVLQLTSARLRTKTSSGFVCSSGTPMRHTVSLKFFIKVDLARLPDLLQSAEKNLRTIGCMSVPTNTMKHNSCAGPPSPLSISTLSDMCCADNKRCLVSPSIQRFLRFTGFRMDTSPHFGTHNAGMSERATILSVSRSRRP